MKIRKVIILIFVIASAFNLISCHNDGNDVEEEDLGFTYDCMPIELWIRVVNASGHDLLDNNVNGNILDEKMTVTFKEFPRDVAMTKPNGVVAKSRTLNTTWYGPYIWQTHFNEKFYVIAIGEYDGELSKSETMTLEICRQKYILSFTNTKYSNGKNKLPDFERTFYLDGKMIQSGESPVGLYTITLDR